MRRLRGRTRFNHAGRWILGAVGVLVLGAVLGVVGLKAAHRLHVFVTVSNGAQGSSDGSVAEASAGYDLDAPTSVALAGADLFVANELGNSVSVVNASTGAHVATIKGGSFDFDRPTSIVASGPDLFVANGSGNSVTEINSSSRSLVRTISGAQFRFSDPIALAASHGRLFVLSAQGPVTAITVASGSLSGVASSSHFGFSQPLGIAAGANDLFVTNSTTDTVTVINEKTMTLVANLHGPGYNFQTPTGAAIDGNDLWVTNEAGDSVTEVAIKTDRPVRVVVDHTNLPTPGPITVGDGYVFTVSPPGDSPMVTQVTPNNGSVPWMMCNTNGPYLFSNPQAAVVSGSNLWIVSKASSSLTEMDTDSGDLIRTIS